jgi:hypothetical protein
VPDLQRSRNFLGSREYKWPLPVDARVVDRDWLIAELLRREAERVLGVSSPK